MIVNIACGILLVIVALGALCVALAVLGATSNLLKRGSLT